MKKILLCLLLITVSFSSEARLEDIFNQHTTIDKPFEMRDPFQAPKFQSSTQRTRKKRFSGVWDQEQKLTQDLPLDQVKITGVLIGKERRVIIQVGQVNYKLKEKETLGPNGPEIKAILPGGIILVEQITNIYGEAEYIETVIPISK